MEKHLKEEKLDFEFSDLVETKQINKNGQQWKMSVKQIDKTNLFIYLIKCSFQRYFTVISILWIKTDLHDLVWLLFSSYDLLIL